MLVQMTDQANWRANILPPKTELERLYFRFTLRICHRFSGLNAHDLPNGLFIVRRNIFFPILFHVFFLLFLSRSQRARAFGPTLVLLVCYPIQAVSKLKVSTQN